MIVLKRDELDRFWKEHIQLVANPRFSGLIGQFQKEVGITSESIRKNKKEMVELLEKLFNDKWVKENHRLWEGIRIIEQGSSLKEDKFLNYVEQNIHNITEKDAPLGNMVGVRLAIQGSTNVSPAVRELRSLIGGKKPLEIASYVSANDKRLVGELTLLKNRQYAESLHKSLVEVKAKYDFLIQLRQYFQGWITQILCSGRSLQLAVQVAERLVIDLGKRDMNDLAQNIRATDAFKNMVMLPEEIKYLGNDVYETKNRSQNMGLLYKINLGENEGNWDHFYKFYNALDKEGHDLVKEFGDDAVRRELLEFKAKNKMWLVGWKDKIEQITLRLRSRNYQLGIIAKGLQAAITIIKKYVVEKSEEHINTQIKPSVRKLQVLVKERGKIVNKKKVLSLCRLRGKDLMKMIIVARKTYKKEEGKLHKLWEEANKVEGGYSKYDILPEHLAEARKAAYSKRGFLNYLIQSASRINGNLERNTNLINHAQMALSIAEEHETQQRLSEIRLIRQAYSKMTDERVGFLAERLKGYNEALEAVNLTMKKALGMDRERKVMAYGR